MPAIPPPYTDYIPASDADYNAWLSTFEVQYALSGLVVPDPVAVTSAALSFNGFLLASTSGATRGPASISAKDVSRTVTEALARLAAQAMVAAYKNGVLTATQLVDAGVRVPSDVKTPRLPPATGPDLVIRRMTPGMLQLTVIDPVSGSFRKPIGVIGAEIVHGVFTGDPPVPPAVFPFLQLATRKVVNIDTSAWTNLSVIYVARWLTVRGANSPFGAGTVAVSA